MGQTHGTFDAAVFAAFSGRRRLAITNLLATLLAINRDHAGKEKA
jgi:hypothetical protein